MDLSNLSQQSVARINALAVELLKSETRESDFQHVLNSGDWPAVEAWARNYSRNPREQFVPRKTYSSVRNYQRVGLDVQPQFEHPLWPVVMRGSIWSMQHNAQRTTSARLDLSDEIFDRWARMTKLTAFDQDEFWQEAEHFIGLLSNKFGQRATRVYDFSFFKYGTDRHNIFLRGKIVRLNGWQYKHIRAMRDIVAKTDRLDARVSMARDWRSEALAA